MKNKLQLITALTFVSGIFWMRNTEDLWAWSLYQLLIAAWVFYFLKKETHITLPVPIKKAFIVFLSYMALSLFWTSNLHEGLLSLLKFFSAALAIWVFLQDMENWKTSLQKAVLGVGVLLIFLVLTKNNFFLIWMGSHPNFYSLMIGCAAILITQKIEGDNKKSWGWGLLLIMSFVAIALSLSFSSWIAVALALCTVHYFWLKQHVRIAGALAIIFITTAVIPWNGELSLWQRKLADPGTWERVKIWRDCLAYLQDYAIFGSGPGTFREFYPQYKSLLGTSTAPYAHNEPLQWLCELGIVGSLLLFLLLQKSLKKSLQLNSAWLGILILLSFQSAVDFNLRYAPFLILFCAIIAQNLQEETSEIKNHPSYWPQFLLIIFSIIILLPGVADGYFYFQNIAHPEKIQQAATTAAQIDPLNARYHFEQRSLQSVARAIELEPRNVWFQRALAQSYLQRAWIENKPEYLQEASALYENILHLAPQVEAFHTEAAQLQAFRAFNKKH